MEMSTSCPAARIVSIVTGIEPSKRSACNNSVLVTTIVCGVMHAR